MAENLILTRGVIVMEHLYVDFKYLQTLQYINRSKRN